VLLVGCIWRWCWAARTTMDDREYHKWMALWHHICCWSWRAISSTDQWNWLGHGGFCSTVLWFCQHVI